MNRFGQRMVGNIAETALIDDITMSKLTLTQVIKICFLVNMNQGMASDNTYWDPVITYEDGTRHQAFRRL